MYVVPFALGPLGSPLGKMGVQITDSPYVVVSMNLMTRMGQRALQLITDKTQWVPAVHSVGAPLLEETPTWRGRAMTPSTSPHFPETREIWSFGSQYGGNALLAKKAFALRIASVLAHDEGWLAEHMLILKVTSPHGRVFHLAAAFPSRMRQDEPGDAAPHHPGMEGRDHRRRHRLVAPRRRRTPAGDQPGGRLLRRCARAQARRPTRQPSTPSGATRSSPTSPCATTATCGGRASPRNRRSTSSTGRATTGRRSAALRRRIRTPASPSPPSQCPIIADTWDDPQGVVIDAIIFGGRRASNVPLVVEAREWEHGVFLGATVSSERTAAAEGQVGELRRDPFAMMPFCGYNMADHWSHWLSVGRRLRQTANVPRIFQVNWFRKGTDGSYLWPGFAENMRVLEWILQRVDGAAGAVDTPLGLTPLPGSINVDGLDLADGAWSELFGIDRESWLAELDGTEEFFALFGDRLPVQLSRQLASIRERLTTTVVGAD